MNFSDINSWVKAILDKLGDLTLPIKVEDIAKSEGLKVVPYPLEDSVSGLLVIENGQGIIGYNQNESRVRRRFTIAHELGHFILHRDKANLFVDKQFKVYRSQNSSTDATKQAYEKEANAFAASLLMPEQLIIKEVEKTKIDMANEEGLKQLAKIFDVSSIAMSYRISNL